MLPPKSILAILEIIYFVPVLVLAVIVSLRHGFAKQLGWFSIVILSLFRLSGSATEIAANAKPSVGLVTAAIILQSFGLASIIISSQGLLYRLNSSLSQPILPPRVFRLLHLGTSAAIGISIGGAVEISTSSTPSSTGHALQRAGIIIFLALTVLLTVFFLVFVSRRSEIPSHESPVVVALAVVLPMLLIALITRTLAVFDVSPATLGLLSTTDRSVVTQALTVVLEEFVCAAVILWAGFNVPKLATADAYNDDPVITTTTNKQQQQQFQDRRSRGRGWRVTSGRNPNDVEQPQSTYAYDGFQQTGITNLETVDVKH